MRRSRAPTDGRRSASHVTRLGKGSRLGRRPGRRIELARVHAVPHASIPSMPTLLDLLDGSVRRYGERPALALRRDDGTTMHWSFRELDRRARIAAWRLRALGLEPGDRILTWSPSTPELPGRLLRGDAGAARPRPARPAHVGRRGRGHRPRLRGPPPHPGHRPRRAGPARSRPGPLPDHDRRGAERRSRRRTTPTSRPTGRPARRPGRARPPHDVFELVFTSGTTGTPKGVTLTHDNVVASIESFHRIVPPMDHRIVSLLPLSHLLEQAVGPVLRARRRGRHPVRPQPQPAGHLRCAARPPGDLDGRRPPGPRPVLERHRARGREARPDAPPSTACGPSRGTSPTRSGGACSAASTSSSAASSGCSCRRARSCRRRSSRPGRTSASRSCRATAPPRRAPARARRSRTTGRARSGAPPEGIEMRLAPDGEIQFRGRTVFSGYWNAPEATAAAFTDDGWYRTGDIGHLDAGGPAHPVGPDQGHHRAAERLQRVSRGHRERPARRRHPRRGRGRDAPRPDRGGRPGHAIGAPNHRGRRHGTEAPAAPPPPNPIRPPCAPGSTPRSRRPTRPSARTSGSPAGDCGPRRTSRGRTRSRSSVTRSGPGSPADTPLPVRRDGCRRFGRQFATGNPTPTVSSAVWIAGRAGSWRGAGQPV